MSEIRPFLNVPTGEFIKEELEDRSWSQEDLAEILGMTTKSISQIINGKQSITLDTAQMLGKAFGQSPQYWINLDTNYRLMMQKETQKITDVEIKSTIYRYMPVKEMVNKNWISRYPSVQALVDEIKNYWKISDIDFSFLEKEAEYLNSSKSQACSSFNTYFALTWFQKARSTAEKLRGKRYQKELLLKICENYHLYTLEKDGINRFIEDIHKAGILFMVLPHLQKTCIDAASFCQHEQPVIVYTARYDRTDHFWFSMAHEISHILHDFKNHNDYYIDDMDHDLENNKENKANSFAAELLHYPKIIEYFKDKSQYISAYRVHDCAKKYQIDPGIIVGALQRYKTLNTRNLNRLKQPVLDNIPEEYKVGNGLK